MFCFNSAKETERNAWMWQKAWQKASPMISSTHQRADYHRHCSAGAAGLLHCAILVLIALPWLAGSHPVVRSKAAYTDALQTERGAADGTGQESTGARMISKRVTNEAPLWPNGLIPYTFYNNGWTEEQSALYQYNVHQAMEWWQNATCVQFFQVEHNTPTLTIRLNAGEVRCSTYVGHGTSYSYLDETCLDNVGKIAHEIGHAIGLYHEHTRSDRNKYITVDMDNVVSPSEYVIETQNHPTTTYDLNSIMHYPPRSGDAKNLSLPIFWLKEGVIFPGTIGQRDCLSFYDIVAVNSLYSCSVPEPARTSCNYRPITFTNDFFGILFDPLWSGSNSNGSNSSGSNESEPSSGSGLASIQNELDAPSLAPPRRNPNLLYPGDIVAFKSMLPTENRWIGCPENQLCYAWGCPGSKFNKSKAIYCPFYEFTISLAVESFPQSLSPSPSPYPPSALSRELRSGDRVVLKQCISNCSNDSVLYTSLDCSGEGEQCVLSQNTTCLEHHWQHSATSECRHREFALASVERGIGRRLRHKDRIRLDDPVSASTSLACLVRNTRKRQRTCQMSNRLETDYNEHHFTVYKLNQH